MNYNTITYGWSIYHSLLEELEAHQLAIEFQCRSGFCGMCRLRLLSGSVRYYQQPLGFINPGEILPCCCLPLNDIELELFNFNISIPK